MPLDGNETEYETKPLTEVQKVLLRAAEIIEQRGHAKAFGRHNAPDSQCVVTAISLAEPQDESVRQAARDAFCDAAGVKRGPQSNIFSWNDSPGRTQSEVIAALRTAALDTSKGE